MLKTPRLLGEVKPNGALHCPKCGKPLGSKLKGRYETTCPRCKNALVFVSEP